MSENQYFYGNPNENGIEQAICTFAAHESLHSEKTSSLPLVEFWKSFRSRSFTKCRKEFLSSTELTIPAHGCFLCFEYPVSLKKVRGKSSMTDLMIKTPKQAIAIEAKYTECIESSYETIGQWLQKSDEHDTLKNHRQDVLQGWWKYINDSGCATTRYITDVADYESIPYQLLHRIASACHVNHTENKTGLPVVIYHIFFDSDTEKYAKKFASDIQNHFDALGLNIQKIDFKVILTRVKAPDKDAIPKITTVDPETKQLKEQEDYNELFLKMLNKKNSVYTFHETTKFSK